jgi:hypothetical protein
MRATANLRPGPAFVLYIPMLPGLSSFERRVSLFLEGSLPLPPDEPTLAEVLTTGYAHVASLEAECLRLQRTMQLDGRLAATRRRADALRGSLRELAERSRALSARS